MDIIDQVLKDMQDYTQSLIREDPTVWKQIQDYIKKREINEEKAQDEEEGKILDDEDFADYRKSIEEQMAEDASIDIEDLTEDELASIRKYLEGKENDGKDGT